MCCYRKKKKRNSDSKTPPAGKNSNSVVQQKVEIMPPQTGVTVNDQAIQPKDVGQPSNPKSLGISSTMNQAPKKGNTKEGNERTCQTMPGTVDETKSKLQSCVSHDQPTTAAPPSLKPESVKNPANSKKSAVLKIKRKKQPGETSKKQDGAKQDESEHFEEGQEAKSKEDPSVDDTLKGIGVEMPHFES